MIDILQKKYVVVFYQTQTYMFIMKKKELIVAKRNKTLIQHYKYINYIFSDLNTIIDERDNDDRSLKKALKKMKKH